MMWEAAKRVIEKIEQAGFEAVFVGGVVRDFIIGKPNNDVDVATSALPAEVKAIFQYTIDVGIEHGTVLVLDEGEPIEVTTYRTDGLYTDHRRPDEVTFVRTLKEDLARRDFTMNAMAMTRTGTIIDLYNGQEDIQKKVIRAVGYAEQRFQEDALRMIRAIRFSAQLGFTIEFETMSAIKTLAEQIQYVAKERVHAEFNKMWVSRFPAQGMAMLEQTTLSQYLQGSFIAEDWHNFQTTNPLVGWAYFYVLNEQEPFFSYYKCSNKEKVFAKQVAEAYSKLQEDWQVHDYFYYELDVLETAFRIAEWRRQAVAFSVHEIAARKAVLPIATIQQLAISGRDLMEWAQTKGGAWLKEALHAALLAVLTKQVENNKEQLKEWFHDIYKG
ncbi:CCA tRNA nucleotidyltransferase [Metasolibacillus meyeri]|uniref:CCA tRNA nucleotidyltransferase n=1 Tax=Metasolibacillus meyeri TaxID=1071052 RepID=A0AAW9NRI3_9BACL|nr:CCA tRNA nucleotidyltransferase [Metasolibacillus meyeri]MEC1179076.1 CCA tRNA nucleotidyltransferase [Metasolibacillus meyeri]